MINFVRKLDWRNAAEGSPRTIVFKEDLLRYENALGDMSDLVDTGRLSDVALLRQADACPLQPGLFYGSEQTPFGSTTPAASNMIGTRLVVGRTTRITQLGVNVFTAGAAGALLRFGIYKLTWTASGWTTALLVDAGTVDAATTGVKTVTVSVPVTAGDTVVPVVVVQGGAATSPSIGAVQGIDAVLGAQSASTQLTAVITGLQASSISGALPANPAMIVSGTAPRTMIMAAT